ncbi:uracil-xanthine permease family protein [Bacteroides heparinolyticus]|uniref:uracil-xanthine permease family protein n=1 Tax=Prevotella heparinolytica TaxID=28113 RepID=UPI003FA189AD
MRIETLSTTKKAVVGVQFLFVAFGATVLVPLLVGINPSTALFTAGLGTFIFHFVTKGKVPIFLGSSFAFIAPIIAATEQWGLPGTLAGLTSVSLVYFLMSALVKWQGKNFLNRVFPPVVIGPVIILIGLSLSGSAVNMAKTNWLLAFISLITAILVLTYARGLVKLVPVICGIITGYIAAMLMGVVDLAPVAAAPWFTNPVSLSTITHFQWAPFLYMIPVAIAPVIEHIGDVYVVSAVAEKDFVKEPGLHRTMLGDGLACLASAFLGGPPETTYSEVTGAMSITKVTSPAVIRVSAATALVFSVIGKLSAVLQSIPEAVLGGIMLLLFGTIASVGVQNLIQHKVDMNETRNVIIVSVTLTMGIGGAVLSADNFALSGIGLSAIVGVLLNLLLPKTKQQKQLNRNKEIGRFLKRERID